MRGPRMNGSAMDWPQTRVRPVFAPLAGAVGMVAAFLSAGCSSPLIDQVAPPQHTLGCVDDSQRCIDQRAASFKGLMSDRERRWIREPATPQAYASGVRLFAYKGRKRELSCDELAIGKREADAGPAVLRSQGGAGLTPAQISRGTMLSGEVAKELALESRKRCHR
jgi:hypothetical protein